MQSVIWHPLLMTPHFLAAELGACGDRDGGAEPAAPPAARRGHHAGPGVAAFRLGQALQVGVTVQVAAVRKVGSCQHRWQLLEHMTTVRLGQAFLARQPEGATDAVEGGMRFRTGSAFLQRKLRQALFI
eukprot:1157358-Pelagomonas_calceolata.AAC.15